jgi:hypothetical protein
MHSFLPFIYLIIFLGIPGAQAAHLHVEGAREEYKDIDSSMASTPTNEPAPDVLLSSEANVFDYISHLSSARFKFSDVTLVYSNFDLYIASTPQSEAEKAAYLRIAHALGQIETNMVIFTTVSNAPIMRVFRGDLPTLFVAFTKRSSIPLFNNAEALFNATQENYLTSFAKPWFLYQTARRNLFKSRYFVYLDLHLFPIDSSTHQLRSWPSCIRIDSLLRGYNGSKSNAVFLSAINVTSSCLVANETSGECIHHFTHCAGVFGGSDSAIEKHFVAFAAIVNHFFQHKTLFQDENHVTQQILGAFPNDYLLVHPTSELISSAVCGPGVHPLYLLIADPAELSPECAATIAL